MPSVSTVRPKPFLPTVEHDIFISYKHLEQAEDSDPWMDTLYKCLERELEKRLGRISMFRDNLFIQAGDNWQEELRRTLGSSPVFLAVLSEPYFSSAVCAAEWDLFMSRMQARSGLADEGVPARKLFPILRLPFSHPVLDSAGIQWMRFFDPPCDGRDAREFSVQPGLQPDSSFYEAVLGLAQNLHMCLRGMVEGFNKQLMPVYLSTVDALHDDPRRGELARDLQSNQDLRLLPDEPYFWTLPEQPGIMARHLDAARLSLFVVVHDGDALTTQRTAAQLEQAIASARRQHAPKPMVWVPSGQRGTPEAEALIARLRLELAGDIELFDGCDIEAFKTDVFETLKPLRDAWAASLAPAAAEASGKVAVVVAESDVQASGALMSSLTERFQRDARRMVVSAAKPLSHFAEKLAAMDAAIVVWGDSDEDWVQDALDDPACRALRERGALGAYLAMPVDGQKASFSQLKVTPLRGDALDAALGAFLDKLRPAS